MPTKSQKITEKARKQAALRRAVHELLPRIISVVREGGSVPLRSVVEAIGGETIESKVRQALDKRGSIEFAPGADGKATFENPGDAATLGLKAIKLKIPTRLSGRAEVLDGDKGVQLRFEKHRSLSACKALVCADVEAVELTKERIFVDMEGKAFDRTFELGAEEGGEAATAGEKKQPAREPKKGAQGASARKESTPAREGKGDSQAATAREEKEPAPKAKEAPQRAQAREEQKPAPDARKGPAPRAMKPAPRRPPEAPRTAVQVKTRKEERAVPSSKAALDRAARDAKSNIRSGVEKTLKSAAESQWEAKQATRRAARDAMTTVHAGVEKTRKAAAANRGKLEAAGEKARSSARKELDHARETVRRRGSAAKAKSAGPRAGGRLGLTTYPVRLPARVAEEHGATRGLIVLAVQPHGPGDEAGLQLGDTLVRLDGSPLRTPGDLRALLSPERIGRKLDATLVRAGRTRHATVEVGAG